MKYMKGIQVYSLIEVCLKHAIRDGWNGPGCVAALLYYTYTRSIYYFFLSNNNLFHHNSYKIFYHQYGGVEAPIYHMKTIPLM